MQTRRAILSRGLVALLMAAAPVRAFAKNGGNSGNGGGGNGGNSGGGKSEKGGNNGSGGAKQGSKTTNRAPDAERVPDATRRYRNGMIETVHNGRYEMRDAQGRSIVSRPATLKDFRRLTTRS